MSKIIKTRLPKLILCSVCFLVMMASCHLTAEAASNRKLVVYYDFANNLNNTALSDRTYLQWSGATTPGYGLQTSISQDISAEYSIALRFSYSNATPGYKKIIDYSNFATDNGFYLQGGKLTFFPLGTSATGKTVFNNNDIIDLIITRNSSNKFTVYSIVNGIFEEEFSYTDTTGISKGYNNGSKTIFGFLRDDTRTTSEFSSGGKVYSIKMWNYALTKEEAHAAAEPISVTYKKKDGTTIKKVSYAPGSVVTVDSMNTADEFRGWLSSDGTIYQAGNKFNIQTATTLTAITVPNAPTWENSGGKEDTMANRDAAVTLESGTVKQIWGCGKDTGTSIRNVVLNLQGGKAETVSTYDNSLKVTGTKQINVSGNPVITEGIDLSTTTERYAHITGELTGDTGSIRVSNPSADSDGTVVAQAAAGNNAAADKFALTGSNLVTTENKITIYNNLKVTTDHRGMTENGSMNVLYSRQIPETIIIPVTEGYTFGGYFTEVDGGGIRYYNADGTRAYTDAVAQTGDFFLYADWKQNESTVLLELNGGTANAILTALWLDDTRTAVVNKTEQNVTAENLEQIFEQTVTEDDKGITESDLSEGDILITLDVMNTEEDTNIATALDENDNAIQYYDITVTIGTVDGKLTPR